MTAFAKTRQHVSVTRLCVHHFLAAACLFVGLFTTVPALAQQGPVANPYGRDVEFTVALRERRALIGELALHLSKEGDLSVQLSEFVAALGTRITPQTTQTLLGAPTLNGLVSAGSLFALGFELQFNDAELDLSVKIPLTARPRLDYSVMGEQRGDLGDFDQAARFSLAANLRVTGDYSHSDFEETFRGSGSLNLLGRAGRFGYQSGYRFSSDGYTLFHEGSRIILDDVARALRWQVGDIRSFTSSPLGGDDVLGFGISRETDALQPDRLARIRGTQTFAIQETSQVTVSVNGRVVTRRTFAPGNYNIADFPFVLGRNQVELLILNQSGQQETLSFNQFVDSRLLEAGSDDFGLAFGVASQPGSGGARVYDPFAWTLNAHYIKGISEKLTLGLATTLSDQNKALLATGVYAGPSGVMSGRLGLNARPNRSTIATIGLGWVRVLSQSQSEKSNRTLRIGLDSRVDFDDMSNSLVNASVGYAWPLTKKLNASVDLRVSGTNRSAGFQTSYNLTRDVRLNVSLDWRFNKKEPAAGPGFSIGFSRSFGSGGQARGTYDSRLAESRVSASHSPVTGLGRWSHTLEATNAGQTSGVTASQAALFNRAELATSQNLTFQNGRNSQRIGISASSALAFAKGRMAWGRPVNDSFAIVSGHKTLGGRTVSLDSRGSGAGPLARTGWFGPALVSGLGTYAARVVNVIVEDPPVGYDIGSGTFRIFPPLFGGHSFVVGSDTANTITGSLVLANGDPASLISGTASSPDWPNVAPIIVFTNAKGQFSASGLGKGRWSLTMRGIKGTFDFSIAITDTSLIDVGAIAVGGTF